MAELSTIVTPARRAWPQALPTILSISLVCIVVLGELHLSNSVLAERAELDSLPRLGLIVWSALWFFGLAGLVLLLSGRWAVSLAFANLTALAILLVSATKHGYLHNKLLFTDLYFSLRDWSEVEFLVGHYSEIVVGTVAFVAAAAVALWLLWRVEEASRGARVIGLVTLIVAAAAATTAYVSAIPPGLKQNVFWRSVRDERFFSDLFISTLFFSDLMRAPLSLPHAGGPDPTLDSALDAMQAAQPKVSAKPPHIIVVLHESSVDPAIYFQGRQYEVPADFFTSGDGVRRRLLVNTYGGNTWMSEHGLLLGLDLDQLPGVGAFLGMIGIDRFQHTLVDDLRAEGYLVAANYPSALSFQNTERFYQSIGFQSVQRAEPIETNRDRDYYEFALKRLAASIEQDPHRPTFQLVWTLATHYPYDEPAFPDLRQAEIMPGNPPAEFARRQRIAADDLRWFEAALAQRFPDQHFLLVGFGDHHPKITDGYFTGSGAFDFREQNPTETRLMTYFRVKGVNFDPDYSALSPNASIGYLGEMLLGAARLPASRATLVRRWLRTRCDGLWSSCAERPAVLSANALLLRGDAALIKAER